MPGGALGGDPSSHAGGLYRGVVFPQQTSSARLDLSPLMSALPHPNLNGAAGTALGQHHCSGGAAASTPSDGSSLDRDSLLLLLASQQRAAQGASGDHGSLTMSPTPTLDQKQANLLQMLGSGLPSRDGAPHPGQQALPLAAQPKSGGIAHMDASTQAIVHAVAAELANGRMDAQQAARLLGSLLPSGALSQLSTILQLQQSMG